MFVNARFSCQYDKDQNLTIEHYSMTDKLMQFHAAVRFLWNKLTR